MELVIIKDFVVDYRPTSFNFVHGFSANVEGNMGGSKLVVPSKVNLGYDRDDRFTSRVLVDKSGEVEGLLQEVSVYQRVETLSDAS